MAARRRKAPREEPQGYAESQAALAHALGLSVSGIRYCLAAGAPSKGSRGWDVEAWRAWRSSSVDVARGGAGGAADQEEGERGRLLRAQADERRAKADLADLRLKIERGDYVALSEIETWDRSRIAIVKRGLLGLPRKASSLVVGLSAREVEVVLMREVRDLLNRYASIKR